MQNNPTNWQKKLAAMTWHQLALEDLEPVLNRDLLPEDLFDSSNSFLEDYTISFYVDFDNNYFSVFTLLHQDGQAFVLGHEDAADFESMDLIRAKVNTDQFLEQLGFRDDVVLPLLRVYRAGYLQTVHAFLYQLLPVLLSEGTVYISPAVQGVFFKADLPVKVAFSYDRAHQQLELQLQLSDDFTSQELQDVYYDFLDDSEDRFFQAENDSLYDLSRQNLFFFLEELGWSELDLQRKKKIFPLIEIPHVLLNLDTGLSQANKAYKRADTAAIWQLFEQLRPLDLSLPQASQARLASDEKEILSSLAGLFSAGFGGAVLFKKEKQLQKLVLYLVYLVQNQYQEKQALYLGSPAELAWLAQKAQELFPDLAIKLIQGPADARRRLLQPKAGPACLYLTSYTLFMNDFSYYEKLSFDLVLLAVSKRLDYENKTARAIRQLKAGNVYVFGDLNIYDDRHLWSLVSLVLAEHYQDQEQFHQECEESFHRVSARLGHYLLEAEYF